MITAPGTPNSQAKRYLILISSAGSLTASARCVARG